MSEAAKVWLVVGITLAVVMVYRYLIRPLFVRFSVSVEADLVLGDTEFETLNISVIHQIRDAVAALTAAGFEVVANVSNNDKLDGTTSIRLLLIHEPLGCWAEVISVSAGRPPSPPIDFWAIVFRTRSASGAEIVTANSNIPSDAPADERCDTINARWVTDPVKLFAIHCARVGRSPMSAEPRFVPPRAHDALEFIRQQHRAEMEHAARHGYYRFKPKSNRFVMTLKGAYLASWRLQWPAAEWRRRRHARHARRVIAQLGLSAT